MKLQVQFCGKMKCTYKVAEKPFYVHKNACFILVWFILVLLKLQQTMEKYYSFQKNVTVLFNYLLTLKIFFQIYYTYIWLLVYYLTSSSAWKFTIAKWKIALQVYKSMLSKSKMIHFLICFRYVSMQSTSLLILTFHVFWW